ncbi:MAG: type IV pilus assembly protein PilM [Armatimonadetes bacterium]|nr:type IV pilus assembly protein PilM [Armatimonadota bacterium]
MQAPFLNSGSGRAALGIDIGSRAVKVLQASIMAGRVAIRAAESFPLKPGIVEQGVIVEPKVFGRALAGFLARKGIQPSSANFSIPSRRAVLRWVNLPVLFGEELRSAARFKVQRHLSFPVKSAYIEACSPKLSEDGKSAEYLVIVVRRDIIDSRAEAIETAGLVPVRAEVEAQSILRVVDQRLSQQSALWRDASLTIIDVGGVNTHMYVVQNQRLQFLRGVNFGSALISSVLAKVVEVSDEAAEEMVAGPHTELSAAGVLSSEVDGQAVRVSVVSTLDKLTREFIRLMRYFRSLHPERSYAGILDHLLLCGGLAGLRGFAEYLQKSLDIRVERIRPFTGVIGNFNEESFENVARHQEAYTVVMGLALTGLKGTGLARSKESAGNEYVWTRSA